MELQITFLGTGGSVPTRFRSLPSVVVRRKGELIMFDCGEGAQRQMILAGIGFCRRMRIFITHMHGDHVFGLPGLLQSMSLLGRRRKLEVYGPPGIEGFIQSVKHTVQFKLAFPLEVHEVSGGVACEDREYAVRAVWADHVVPCLAYALIERWRPGKFNPERARSLGVPEGPLWKKLQEGEAVKVGDKIVKPDEILGQPRPGLKIVYAVDSRPCKAVEELAENADLLIHDASFDDSLREKAEEDGHSTASQAAELAKRARVKRLALIHLSARYGDPELILDQARKIFTESLVPSDLMSVEIEASGE